MYVGRYQLGVTVPLFVQARTGAGAPALPGDAPWAKVWDADGVLVEAAEMPVCDRYARPGLFLLPLFLGRAYGSGLYTASYHYRHGSYYGVQADDFEVLPSGHPDGAVVGMHFYDRPQGRFVVRQLETGKIVQGRNPRVD